VGGARPAGVHHPRTTLRAPRRRFAAPCAQRPLLLPGQFLLDVDEVLGLAKQLEAWRRDIYAPLVIEASPARTGRGRGGRRGAGRPQAACGS
jgi:hypothetical protein